MAEKKAKNPKMSQVTLFETVRKNEKAEEDRQNKENEQNKKNGQSKKSEKQEPASELMKVIAEKIPSKKKILRDFSPAEQAEIFERIQRGKDAAKKTVENERDNFENEARKELIRKIKRLAKDMEIGNKSRIILFPSYSRNGAALEWYKMGDFSALYYTYRMSERMGRKAPTIQKDTDKFYKMRSIVSIRDVDTFIEQAMKLNEFDRHEETADKIQILYLKHALEDDELATLRRTGEMQKEMMHNVLRPKKAAPEMYLTLLMLGRQVMRMVSKLGIIYRYEIGDKVAENTLEMMNTYYDYTGGLIDAETARIEMRRRVYRVRAGMAILGDDDAIRPTQACAIGETVVKIELLIGEMR